MVQAPPGDPGTPSSSVAAACNLIGLICVVPATTNPPHKMVQSQPPMPKDAVNTDNLVQILADTLQLSTSDAIKLIEVTVQRFQGNGRAAIDAFNRGRDGRGGGKDD